MFRNSHLDKLAKLLPSNVSEDEYNLSQIRGFWGFEYLITLWNQLVHNGSLQPCNKILHCEFAFWLNEKVYVIEEKILCW